jgi:hypothetical protein
MFKQAVRQLVRNIARLTSLRVRFIVHDDPSITAKDRHGRESVGRFRQKVVGLRSIVSGPKNIANAEYSDGEVFS